MLKDGYHHSFSELFNLLKREKDEQQRLGPDSGLQDQPLVQDQPEKLEQMKTHLMAAEAAKRRGKLSSEGIVILLNSSFAMKYVRQFNKRIS